MLQVYLDNAVEDRAQGLRFAHKQRSWSQQEVHTRDTEHTGKDRHTSSILTCKNPSPRSFHVFSKLFATARSNPTIVLCIYRCDYKSWTKPWKSVTAVAGSLMLLSSLIYMFSCVLIFSNKPFVGKYLQHKFRKATSGRKRTRCKISMQKCSY